MCRCLWNNLSCIPLGISLRVVLLDHMADLCLVFLRDHHIVFQSGWNVLACIPTCSIWGFLSNKCLASEHLLLFLMVAVLTGVRWNLTVFLICISFMTRDGEHFSCVFWPFGHLPSKTFCLAQLSTYLLVHWFWGSLVCWDSCILWLSVLCLMYSHQIFSPTL
jgi:hypothetical protein